MTRPDDIPQRVWDEAQSVMMESRLFMIATDDFDEHSSIIARALVAAEQREREHCAQVCDAESQMRTNWMETRDADWPEMKERQRVGAQQSRLLAAAIRNRKETP